MTDSIPISITICGDGGAGKSSITLRLVRSQWTNEYDPTIEDSYSVRRQVDGKSYFLSLTDTAGQEEYRSLWAASNLHSEAFLLVYDITNPDSLYALEHFLDLIEMEAETRADGSAASTADNLGRDKNGASTLPPVRIIAGNKCDLVGERKVPAREGLEFARRRGCGFMETSARNIVNIEETFALIVKRVTAARASRNEQSSKLLSPTRPPRSSSKNSNHPTSPTGTNPNYGPNQGYNKTLPPRPDAHILDGVSDEKGGNTVGGRLESVELEDRPGARKMGVGGFWARLRCW